MVLLGEIVDIKSGMNSNRVKKDAQEAVYSMNDFEEDFYHMNSAPEDSCIIYCQNLTSTENMHIHAVVQSVANKNKAIYQAFALIRPDTNIINTLYLSYLLNCSQSIERRRRMLTQGSVIARMFASVLKDVSIELPDMETQRRIGKIYATAVHEAFLEKMQAEKMMGGIIAVLRKADKN